MTLMIARDAAWSYAEGVAAALSAILSVQEKDHLRAVRSVYSDALERWATAESVEHKPSLRDAVALAIFRAVEEDPLIKFDSDEQWAGRVGMFDHQPNPRHDYLRYADAALGFMENDRKAVAQEARESGYKSALLEAARLLESAADFAGHLPPKDFKGMAATFRRIAAQRAYDL